MHCPVEEMLRRISSRELVEWVEYFKLKNRVPEPEPDPMAEAIEAQRSQEIEEFY